MHMFLLFQVLVISQGDDPLHPMMPQPHLSAPDKLHNILCKPKRYEKDGAGLAVGRIPPEL